MHDTLSCAYCGQPNSLASVTCVGCDHPLTRKRGRPTENPDVPCPTCGQPSSAASVICVGCNHPLTRKRGRPNENPDVPCPTCCQPNSAASVICAGCDHPLTHKRSRPTENPDVPCPTCGQPNSPASVTCVGCDQSLKHKRGRPSEVADVPCLTCGQSNGSKNVKCVGCDQLLEYKRGRPIVCKGSTADVSCPNSHELNTTGKIVCDNCGQPLKRKLRGRPVVAKDSDIVCHNCLYPNSSSSIMCTRCGETFSVKRGRTNKSTTLSAASDISVAFDSTVELPTAWNTSIESVNLSESLLTKLKVRCVQQREFDKQALGDGVCYNCGRVLWATNVTSKTSLPNGLDADSAPASSYLQAVPNCRLHFIALSGSDSGDKWFCCSHCKSKDVPIDQHVGDIFDEDGSVKPVSDWDMAKPEPISALANQNEKHQILCRLLQSEMLGCHNNIISILFKERLTLLRNLIGTTMGSLVSLHAKAKASMSIVLILRASYKFTVPLNGFTQTIPCMTTFLLSVRHC